MRRFNERGIPETVFGGEHLRLEDLRLQPVLRGNNYLHKDVPLVPIPLEFQITKVIHVTGKSGMRGILGESGLRLGENAGYGNGTQFLWWSLAVDDADLLPAQHRFLKAFLPHITPEEVENHPEFLSQFTTSTAFKPGSRYGNFKFTSPLKELLQKYRDQFCEGESPVLRVYKTVVYKKEIVHVVVIHSPDVLDFDECPILQDNEDVPYALRDGSLLWRPRAISDCCYRNLVTEEDGRSVRVEEVHWPSYFMWEHGALAFHLPPGQTLRFERDELINSLSACDKLTPDLCRDGVTYEEAKTIVAELKDNR
ncbi:uncharacterized protein [Paramormyrops kingsleyae]|uniref:uncharacterized protein n=1 Tax=Paramormyrops kingsleyae TaxID=1676925 RepID=UPI003B975580